MLDVHSAQEQDDDNNIVKIGNKAAGTINRASVECGFEFRIASGQYVHKKY